MDEFLLIGKKTYQLSIESRQGRQASAKASYQDSIKLLVLNMVIEIANQKSS